MLTEQDIVNSLNNNDIYAIMYNQGSELFIVKDRKDIFKKYYYFVSLEDFLDIVSLESDITWSLGSIDRMPNRYKTIIDNQIKQVNQIYVRSFSEKNDKNGLKW
jgi:hypothetical protein